ncbi:MAG: GNAT family N-acetyltransferase, partial [Flavobacteriaceae bacterium]
MKLVQTNQGSKDFQQLVAHLDAELAIRDGDDHAFYHQFNGIESLDHVIIAYDKDQPVGCGAFKARNNQQVEIKRMFVLTAARKNGYATAILTALETWAVKEGYSEAILETGKAQIEALSFYPKQGYTVIPNF